MTPTLKLSFNYPPPPKKKKIQPCYCFTCLAGFSFSICSTFPLPLLSVTSFQFSFSAFCCALSAAPGNSLLCLSCFHFFLEKSATFGSSRRQIDITELGLCPQEGYWLCSIKARFLWAERSGFFTIRKPVFLMNLVNRSWSSIYVNHISY